MNPRGMRLAGYQSPGAVHSRAARQFAEQVQTSLGTRFPVELTYDVADLGHKSGDLPQLVESGELDICYTSMSRLGDRVPAFGVFDVPFSVADRDAAMRAADSELGRRLAGDLEGSTGLRLLGIWDNSFRHITNSVRPISEVADCCGLRIRTMTNKRHGAIFRSFGFEPVPIDATELAAALIAGRVQAQENPLANTYSFGIYRLHKYVSLTGHLFSGTAFICNRDRFDAWPRHVQDAVLAAAANATTRQRALAKAEDTTALERMREFGNEIVVPTPEALRQFADASAGAVADLRHYVGGEVLRLLH